MPKIKVQADSTADQKSTFDKVCLMLQDDRDLKKLDPKYVCQFDNQGMTGTAQGQHFKADMNVIAKGSGSEVEITVELPFHLALAKGMVQKTLKQKLDAALS